MVTYHYGGIIRGTAAERTGGTWTNLPLSTLFIETDTEDIFDWDGIAWRQKGGGGGGEPDSYTWFVYKSGSNYKTKNGILGTVPTGGISTNMNETWTYIRDNFNLAGEETNRGGKVQFGKGVFDFTTGEMLVDNTMQDGGIVGVILQGMKAGTLLRFFPATPQANGLHVRRINEVIVRDLDIQSDDNVTNAVHIEGSPSDPGITTEDTEGGLYDNLRIFKQGTKRQAGTRGIWMNQTHVDSSMHFNVVRKVQIKEYETASEVTSAGNATFLQYDGIFIWQCLRGIKINTLGLQNLFNNIIFQATSVPQVGEYALSVTGINNCINNVNVDKMDAPGSAAVILQPGAAFTQITNVLNSSGLTILDRSGNDSNSWTNYENALQPTKRKKYGEFTGASITAGTGLLGGGFTRFTSPDTGTVDDDAWSTIVGKNVRFVSAAVANAVNGITSNKRVARRRANPVMRAVFENHAATSQRFFIGLCEELFTTTGILPGNSDTVQIPTAKSCLGVAIRSGDTVYQVIRNDSTGDPEYTNLLDNNNNAISVDNGLHTCWIHIDDSQSPVTAYISLNNNKPMVFTTNIPTQDANLYIVTYVQTTIASIRALNVCKMTLEIVK